MGLLRRPGVDVACWASVVGGAWWSMVGSFVPVILVGAGVGPQAIGWLISASEGAGTTALIAFRNVSPGRIPGAVRLVGALLSVMTLAPALVIVAAGALLPGLAAGRRR